MDIASALCLALGAFWWGEWWAERKTKPRRDPALTLLVGMVSQIIENRKFVGRGLEITREEHFELNGERFSISVKAAGGPLLIETEPKRA